MSLETNRPLLKREINFLKNAVISALQEIALDVEDGEEDLDVTDFEIVLE